MVRLFGVQGVWGLGFTPWVQRTQKSKVLGFRIVVT